MSEDEKMNEGRRRLIFATVGSAAVVASCYPLVSSMNPSERAKAASAPVEVDIGDLKPGEIVVVEWRGKPVWVLKRTPEMLDGLRALRDQLRDPDSEMSEQPGCCRNETRSIKPEIMVALNVCTHLGCSPTPKFMTGRASGISEDWPGGLYCPCHGSTYDLAGRVFKDKLATRNLEIPPYRFINEGRIIIGEESGKGA